MHGIALHFLYKSKPYGKYAMRFLFCLEGSAGGKRPLCGQKSRGVFCLWPSEGGGKGAFRRQTP